ncbi:hypothetical protein Q8F55_000556 [Vanrija albida]|uniref:Uncharacterized protein n=1 Tax=Vanrija albida TaxID=181172 RepID=A0ABR3QDL6_9TREE
MATTILTTLALAALAAALPQQPASSSTTSTTITASRTSSSASRTSASATATRSATPSPKSTCGGGCRAWAGFWGFFVKSWYWLIPVAAVAVFLMWILFTCLPCTNYAKYRRHLARERRLGAARSYGGGADLVVDWVKSLHAVRRKKHKALDDTRDVRDVPLLRPHDGGERYWMPDPAWGAPAPMVYPAAAAAAGPAPTPSPSPPAPPPPPARLARQPSAAHSEQLPPYDSVPPTPR